MIKRKLFIKMTNFEHNISIVCTVNFISKWQSEGFSPVGYREAHPTESVMDVSPTSIDDNLFIGNEN